MAQKQKRAKPLEDPAVDRAAQAVDQVRQSYLAGVHERLRKIDTLTYDVTRFHTSYLREKTRGQWVRAQQTRRALLVVMGEWQETVREFSCDLGTDGLYTRHLAIFTKDLARALEDASSVAGEQAGLPPATNPS